MDTVDVVYDHTAQPAPGELVRLYNSVGWTAYADDPELLAAAIAGSSFVVTARRGGGLVGLARALSDDRTICYVQDVLIDPAVQHRGIGTALVRAVLARYPHVRQKVLLTEDEPRQHAFYRGLGYTDVREFGDGRLHAFVRYDERPAPVPHDPAREARP
jgi:GNAT superfamily N-acetyltransferase